MSDRKARHDLPPLPQGFTLPFFYGTFTNIGFDYLLDDADEHQAVKALLREDAAGRYLSPAVFEGSVCLSFNYQLYFAQFGSGTGVTQEIELNVVAHPTAEAHRVPRLTYTQYAHGEDQTRILGFCRVHVACDSDIAIKAGVELFNEPKHKAGFRHTLPVPNATTVDPKAVDQWKVVCGKYGTAAADGSFTPANTYFSFEADLSGLTSQPVSAAPFTEYGSGHVHKDEESPHFRPLAAPLNVLSPYAWHDLRDGEEPLELALGQADPQGRSKAFLDLIVDKSPAGAWVYQSPPVAAQNRPYWVRKA
ncbi:hypothetical protein [Streptomyces diastatochromogenes]|uniref:Acetoacetate decarboxylase n=1 Tax=Streptomyces diastatochromogenes TaxID=42236 RepID=A0A233SEK4_STRDA|nr:hypothetical protein [Streptomyces diastatochromogenes]MCZ0989385.1 hypothetical protein [Streptomyces diastatochromogenes]OXY94081.1 hypothetical protein BEK98_19560 [Streptomyces diastatochromogenes]